MKRRATLLLSCMLCACAQRALDAPDLCVSSPAQDAGVGEAFTPAQTPGPEGYFKISGEHFAVWDGAAYRPLFVRAMDIGASEPGDGPNDLQASYTQYSCWMSFLGASGFNALRLYVPHFPVFYRALADHNRSDPAHSLFLFQGAYLPETEDDAPSMDLYQHAATFDSMLSQLVDVIHGRGSIARGPRGAYGVYDVDVSPWTMGFLVGREVLSSEALATNEIHGQAADYTGKRLRMRDASPTETFMAERLDKLVDAELVRYGSSRPIAWSNWLELDPLTHPTEGSASKKDVVQVDFAKLEPFAAPSGSFVSYHAYPYYPNFVSEDPIYQTYSDEQGHNSYLGLLQALREHHRGQALFIAEFGVPSSRGRAHTSFSGMHHGGLSELQQGVYGARMMRNIASVGAAGFAFFQLTDGWWKRIWITAPITFPAERLRYWHDLMNAQQSYGIIDFQLPAPRWDSGQVAHGSGRIRELRVRYDAELVRLRILLDRPLEADEALNVGLDTYADDRGEVRLPNGHDARRRSEFALIVQPKAAELQVLRAYDTELIGNSTPPPGALFRSVASSSGDWVPIRWRLAAAHGSDDGKYWFDTDEYPAGQLRVRDPAQPSSLDAVTIEGATITVELPWTLLNFSDPTRRSVLDDDVATPERETAVTPGIAFAASLGDDLLETQRLGWLPWSRAPRTQARLKDGVPQLQEALAQLPTWLDRDADAGSP